MRKIDKLIIHCSDTPANRHVTVEDIDKWHKAKGWKGIGYHYVIYLDGSIHKGREDSAIGAHCTGHNTSSIGICYIGGRDGKKFVDTRTEAQKESMAKLLKLLKKKYPGAEIKGHRDFTDKKDCPGFNAAEEYKGL